MDDVNRLFDLYREASRNLWNCYFRRLDGGLLPPENICESFDVISAELFSSIVLHELGIVARKGRVNQIAGDLFDVVLNSKEVPAFVNRTMPAGGYWDYPIETIKNKELVLRFRDFFDWDSYSFVDKQYLRVEVIETDKEQTELVGRHALIECRNARVVKRE